jgi:hypothetical protein
MQKELLIAAVVVGQLSCAAGAAGNKSVAHVNKPPPPDYFPLRVNDWWKYKSTTGDGKQSEFTTKVQSAEKNDDGTVVYLLDTISTQQIHDWYTKPNGLVLRLKEKYGENDSMSTQYQPPYELIKNPLTASDSWQWTGKGMMGVDINDSSEVSGPEEAVVPAGHFRAMKVVTKITQGGSPITKTYWYADWVGLVKSVTEAGQLKTTTELVDYNFRKSPKPSQ